MFHQGLPCRVYYLILRKKKKKKKIYKGKGEGGTQMKYENERGIEEERKVKEYMLIF